LTFYIIVVTASFRRFFFCESCLVLVHSVGVMRVSLDCRSILHSLLQLFTQSILRLLEGLGVHISTVLSLRAAGGLGVGAVEGLGGSFTKLGRNGCPMAINVSSGMTIVE
jgi:hypothetical protein